MFVDFTMMAFAQLDRAAERAFRATGMAIRGEVIKSMKGGGKPHTPSRPGQPPAVESGHYRASIDHDVVGHGMTGKARIGTTDKRGVHLEFGTKRMEARPHFRPILIKNRTMARDKFISEFRRSL